MSIINTQKLKNKKRLIRQPIPSPHFSQKNSKGLSDNTLIIENIDGLPKEEAVENTHSNNQKNEAQYKSYKSEIILQNSHSFRKREESSETNGLIKKPYRYLRIDTIKQAIPHKPMIKSLTKDKNSPLSESLRIHKIKSIVNITISGDKNGERAGRKISLIHSKSNRYDEAGYESQSEREKEGFTGLKERPAIKYQRRNRNGKNESTRMMIEDIKVEFGKLNDEIIEINKDLRPIQQEGETHNLRRFHLIEKNRNAAASIIFRWMMRVLTKRLYQLAAN